MIHALAGIASWVHNRAFDKVEVLIQFRDELDARRASALLVHEWERDLNLLPSPGPDPNRPVRTGFAICGIKVRFTFPPK